MVFRNVFFSAGVGMAGDLVCQRWVELTDRVDWRRTIAVTTFNAIYIGGVCDLVYKAYPWISRRVVRGLERALVPAARLSERSLLVAHGTVGSVVDNFAHVPLIYIPSFYIATGLMRGDDSVAIGTTLRSRWWSSVVSCWTLWIPFQAVNFALIPPNARVGAVVTMNFVWTIVLDVIANRDHGS